MNFNKSFALSFNDGNCFDLHFSEISSKSLPIDCQFPIIDILLKAESANTLNSISDILQISDIIKKYIEENNVILYYYCDTKPVAINKNRNISPQQFRFELFSKLFERKSLDSYIKDDIIIVDNNKDNHYICLITRAENKDEILQISQELQKLQK